MRDFHMTLSQAIDETPLDQAFALRAYADAANPWCHLDLASDGYIAQEAARQPKP